jgi:hypothetical protein
MKLKGFLVVSLVAVMGVFLLSGCCCPAGITDMFSKSVSNQVQKSVEKGIKDTTGTTINTDKTKEVTGEDLKSVPRYTGSIRTLYIKGEPIDRNVSISLTYETTDDPATVSAWYKDKMAGLGWTVTLTVAGTDGGEMITYGKNDNATTATVNVTKNSNGKTDIGIFYNGVAAGA